MTLALLAVASLGCAGGAWDKALRADSPAAFHQFIRNHPKSDHVDEARARIEFHKVKRRPSLQGFRDFKEAHPASPLVETLRPLVEPQAFAAVRAAGTAEAYQAFQEEFGGGAFGARAAGNAAYLAADGFRSQPEALQTFAEEHRESDFAAEARRSVSAIATRSETRFRRIGLEIDVSLETPEVDRLVKAFTDIASKTYAGAGLELVPIPEIASDGMPPVRLRIEHSEGLESASVDGGALSRAGIVALTRVSLRTSPDAEPIWTRDFGFRLDPQDRIQGASQLFASKQAKLYWSGFFVPVATWQSTAAVRPVIELSQTKKVIAVDAVRGRAVVLFDDGDFQLLDLSDPAKPVVLAEYDRPSKLEHFEGVRIVGDQIVIFGQDGLEFVEFGPLGPKAVATRSRGEVGQIMALEPVSEGLALASSRGLILADADGDNAQRVMRRVMLGLGAVGDSLVFTDGESIFVSNIELLRQRRVIAQLRLGREFRPNRVSVADRTAIVMGDGGVVVLDLSRPKSPRVISKLALQDAGRVADATRVGSKVFLLGARGIQLLDGRARRVVESVDVAPRSRFARTGRHLVIVGDRHLQVIDALPFGAPNAAAASPASE